MTDSESAEAIVTAAVLIIGDEILSGRTKDRNIGYIAEYLTAIGIDLAEVRIVPDDRDEIVAAVNALRARYSYLFTTGGIGPTHDDITAESVAAAFGVGIDVDPRALAIMKTRYRDVDLTPARLRMARIPDGADLIANPISQSPGFRLGNVYVMAGIPSIMQAMLDDAAKTLKTGKVMASETVEIRQPEGAIGDPLSAVQAAFPDVMIGSYPSLDDKGFLTRIVVRSRNEARLAEAVTAVRAMLAQISQD
ncbi:MAG: competence/damage-inducible protein A [Hyphomicrobiales bacterium]|nr:competence/damage-inducible protein A [Hyphomicrobiales bacterium]